MHLYVSHHASCHAFHHVKQTSFITCSAYESEKVCVDQVSEKVHPQWCCCASGVLVQGP